jgi:hypothetical protein
VQAIAARPNQTEKLTSVFLSTGELSNDACAAVDLSDRDLLINGFFLRPPLRG